MRATGSASRLGLRGERSFVRARGRSAFGGVLRRFPRLGRLLGRRGRRRFPRQQATARRAVRRGRAGLPLGWGCAGLQVGRSLRARLRPRLRTWLGSRLRTWPRAPLGTRLRGHWRAIRHRFRPSVSPRLGPCSRRGFRPARRRRGGLARAGRKPPIGRWPRRRPRFRCLRRAFRGLCLAASVRGALPAPAPAAAAS